MTSRQHIKKVLLIQPPAFCNNFRNDMNPNVPLGICYIGAMLEREGYQVKILDAFIEGWDQTERVSPEILLVGMSYAQIKAYIAAERPDVVGITSMFTMQRRNAHKVAALAKEVDPGTIVIMGGAHPTAAPEMVLADPNVDAIVLGEGDNSIGPLLRAFQEGADLGGLDGVGFRDSEGRTVIKEKTIPILDVDSLPLPARHLVPMEKYFKSSVRHGGFNKRDRSTSMISSRGCQYRCNFCTAFKVFTRLPRIRSVDSIMAEIDELVLKYGVNEIFFEDDQFLAKQKHTIEVLDRIIERGYDLVWDTPNGISAWLLNETVIKKMKQAGCYRVNLALESGNQTVLDTIINKPVRVDKIPAVVDLIRKYDMEVGTFFVVGNIGENAVETLDQISDSFRLARRLDVRPFVSYLTPYPGSDVLRIAQEKNYLVPGFDWDNLVISKLNVTTPQWTPEQLRRHVEMELGLTLLALILRNPHLIFQFISKNRYTPGRMFVMAWMSLQSATRWLFSRKASRAAEEPCVVDQGRVGGALKKGEPGPAKKPVPVTTLTDILPQRDL